MTSNAEPVIGRLRPVPLWARLVPMAVKVAMLIAAGRPEVTAKPWLDVVLDDADTAVTIATRWQRDALTGVVRNARSFAGTAWPVKRT